jgi:hypothetical protein
MLAQAWIERWANPQQQRAARPKSWTQRLLGMTADTASVR